MTAKIIVAVAGASGELGLLVIESILSRNKNITIRALVRRSTKDLEALEAKYGKSIEITVVDYSSLKGLEIAVDGVYTLVRCTLLNSILTFNSGFYTARTGKCHYPSSVEPCQGLFS